MLGHAQKHILAMGAEGDDWTQIVAGGSEEVVG
jgi:hypothetical protein